MTLRKDRFRLAAVLGCLAVVPVAHAETGALSDVQAKKLFNARSCNACHEVDETRIGPAFRSVALRYHDKSPSTVDWLATKIVQGGAGAWGNVPMVSNPALPPDEARAIARWILSLPPPAEKPAKP